MIVVPSGFKRDLNDSLKEYKDNHKIKSFSFTEFLSNLLPYESNKIKAEYPKEIRLAPSVEEMSRGNFEPSKIIKINSPLTYNGNEIWMGDCADELELHFGYENGDKRYFSQFKINGSVKAHAMIAGSTGSGKSVTFNDILFSWFYLYAPWQLNLWMSDAKVSEFMRYGTMHHIPHIRSIAATADTGYMISVLKSFYDEMKLLNSIFGKLGVRNLKDFRDNTGLTLPRQLFVMDEVKAMLSGAGNKLKDVSFYIEQIGILGRNTGYNMVLAMQDPDSNTKSIVNNSVPIRVCLKCNMPSISDDVLGNSQGAVGDVGVGKLYVNDEPGRQNKDDNVKFRNPYQSDKEFEEQGKFLENLGKELGVSLDTQFYNENFVLDEGTFTSLCEKRVHKNCLVVGEPSFVNKPTDRFEIYFDNTDIENVLVLCSSVNECHRYLKTFYINALQDRDRGTMQHQFLIADDGMMKDIIPENDRFENYRIKETTSNVWNRFVDRVYCKRLVVEADELAFSEPKTTEETNKLLEALAEGFAGIETMRYRFYYILELLKTDRFIAPFGLKGYSTSDLEKARNTIAIKCLVIIKSFGSYFLDHKVTKNDLPNITVHIVGANKINGFGRDYNMNKATNNKKLLMDCYEANTKYIIYTTNVDDMSDYNVGIKHLILDGVESLASKVKCLDYPSPVLDVCGVYVDKTNSTEGSKCFKKLNMIFD